MIPVASHISLVDDSVHVYLRRGRRRSVDLRRNRFQFSNRRATWKLKHDSTPCKLSTCDHGPLQFSLEHPPSCIRRRCRPERLSASRKGHEKKVFTSTP